MTKFTKYTVFAGLAFASLNASADHLTPEQQGKLDAILGCMWPCFLNN